MTSSLKILSIVVHDNPEVRPICARQYPTSAVNLPILLASLPMSLSDLMPAFRCLRSVVKAGWPEKTPKSQRRPASVLCLPDVGCI